MRTLKQYINEGVINEVIFPPIDAFPESLQPYIAALYVLTILWSSVFLITCGEDVTFGISTIIEIVRDKFDDFKYKKQLIEMKKILQSNEDYIKWESNPKRKLKDLKPIISSIKNHPNVNRIIKEIWNESKK